MYIIFIDDRLKADCRYLNTRSPLAILICGIYLSVYLCNMRNIPLSIPLQYAAYTSLHTSANIRQLVLADWQQKPRAAFASSIEYYP